MSDQEDNDNIVIDIDDEEEDGVKFIFLIFNY
jgi:hypothetical protein